MDPIAKRRGLAWSVGGCALLISCIILFRASIKPRLEPLVMVHRPFAAPLSMRDRFERWIPMRWAWAWRIEKAVLGQRKTINLNAGVFSLDAQSRARLEEIAGSASARVASNGLAVWFLPASELKNLRTHLEKDGHAKVYFTRITTADGIGAALGLMEEAVIAWGVTNFPGMEASYFARIEPRATDLVADVVGWGAVTNDSARARGILPTVYTQTNIDIAVRLQVPKGKGVLLIQNRPGGADAHSGCGFILDPL